MSIVIQEILILGQTLISTFQVILYFTEEKTDIIGHLTEHIEYSEKISTAVVGSSGEAIVINHEKQKLREHGQEQLLHLVNFIPTQFGVGYDVQSFECDDSELRKYIEVKNNCQQCFYYF